MTWRQSCGTKGEIVCQFVDRSHGCDPVKELQTRESELKNKRSSKKWQSKSSRLSALVEGLSAQQSDAEFNAELNQSVQSIYEASNT